MTTRLPDPELRAHGVVSHSLLVGIGLYQAIRAGRPSPCRYYPSCSEYAREAIERYGAWRGAGLAARRLGRCQPWGGKGIDLVPDVPQGSVGGGRA